MNNLIIYAYKLRIGAGWIRIEGRIKLDMSLLFNYYEK